MITRPFAYNPTHVGITGTTLMYDIAVGVTPQNYFNKPGGLQWWMGPDESLGYVICATNPSGAGSTPIGNIGTVHFWRSSALTDSSLLSLVSNLSNNTVTTVNQMPTWFSTNQYWTSWSGFTSGSTTGITGGTYNATYYVATTGNDSNSGTSTSPWRTIQKALNTAVAGNAIFVKAGTYHDSWMHFVNSGTLGSPILLHNFGTDVVTIDASGDTYGIYATGIQNIEINGINFNSSTGGINIELEGCSNILIQNITSTMPITGNGGSTARGVQLAPNGSTWCTNVVIKNVTAVGGGYGVYMGSGMVNGLNIIGGTFYSMAYDGLNICPEVTTDTSIFNRNVVVDGCELRNNYRQGMDVIGTSGVTIRNVYSHHNGATGIQLENQVSNGLIEDCTCEYNSQNAAFTYETGIWIDNCIGITVRRCILRHNQTGFRVAASSNSINASYLLIYSNSDGYSDGNSAGVDLSNSTNVYMYNCTIDSNSVNTSSRGSVNFRGTGSYTFKNNIISNDNSVWEIYRDGAHTLTSDYNMVYNTRALNIYNLTGSVTWASYKSATSQDSHSLNANPLYTTPGSNFYLNSGSTAINAGVSISGLTIDIQKNPIVGLPDIGSYEYAVTYYVSTTGNDGNNGTVSSPFLTGAQAVSVATAGNTIIFEDGTYLCPNGAFQMVMNNSGTATSYITVKARNNGKAILDGNGNLGIGAFHVQGSYINIRGFEIRNMLASAIELANGYNYINFSDLNIHDIGRGCYQDDNGRTAFTLGNGSNVVIERCLINTIGAYAPGENGCSYTSGWTGYQTLDHGIYVAGTNYCIIKNNIFYNCKSGFGIQFYSGAGDPSANCQVINNTFYNGNTYQAAGHIILWNSVSNTLLANNIFDTHLNYATRAYQGTYTYSNVTVTTNMTYGGNGYTCTTDAAGVTAVSNLTATNPLFIDKVNHNFNLQANSPAIGAGYNTALTTDYLNNTRISPIDIGAIEYYLN